MGRIAKVFARDGNFDVRGDAIEQHDSATAILHLLGPDFGVGVLADAAALHAKRILIDGDDFLIREDVLDFGRHVLQIVSGHERRSENAPEAESGAIFRRGPAAVTEFEHIGIIPVTRAGVSFQANLQVPKLYEAEVAVLAFPTVGDIAGGAPKVANVFRPKPRLVVAPFAEA